MILTNKPNYLINAQNHMKKDVSLYRLMSFNSDVRLPDGGGHARSGPWRPGAAGARLALRGYQFCYSYHT